MRRRIGLLIFFLVMCIAFLVINAYHNNIVEQYAYLQSSVDLFFNSLRSGLMSFLSFLFGVGAVICAIGAIKAHKQEVAEAEDRARLAEEERQRKARLFEEEKQRKAREEAERIVREQLARQQEEARKKEQEKISKELELIPRFEIRTDGEKGRLQAVSFLSDIKYRGVTERSKPQTYSHFVVLDVETTGLAITKSDVIELAAIRVENMELKEVFHTLLKPEKGLNADAQRINGISEEMVSDKPYLYQVLPSFQEFISGYDLLGQNLQFDLKFLCRAGLDVTTDRRLFFDTMILSRQILKNDVWNHKLETLCDHYGIVRADAHRALGDCVDTVKVFHKLLGEKIAI